VGIGSHSGSTVRDGERMEGFGSTDRVGERIEGFGSSPNTQYERK